MHAVTAENATHVSVLLREVLEALVTHPGGRYLDGTLGLAGHSSALLEKAGETAELCGLDRDPQALARAEERLAPYGKRCHLFALEYASFEEALDTLGWNQVDGALLDLGVSSLQLDVAERGFSLHEDGPLDMRMDMGEALMNGRRREALPHTESARTFVNRADFPTLKRVIEDYGEDPQAGRIARAIVDARATSPIETTRQLAEIVWHAYPPKWRATARNHPATRTFQAIRMVVNDELGQLEHFLDRILSRLAPGGRLAIISFHSLEDRIVKQRFKLWSSDCICPPHLPRCVCGHRAEVRVLTRKPILPSQEELTLNPRSGSAKLRVAEKLPEPPRQEAGV
ncbi:MAG TPA: 16S rRNA (cytosine(1402)-N(4))-methyltransferase RsmH [Candidatus Mailhella merdavium]|nr:16S rRNA (cytosine(1402)-N(4))-methyltransferase RsmH [Candidatus Mailhella merdavium]